LLDNTGKSPDKPISINHFAKTVVSEVIVCSLQQGVSFARAHDQGQENVVIQWAKGIVAARETDREADPIHDFEHGYRLIRNTPGRRAGNAEIVFILWLEGFSAHQEGSL
jgi:hypothetical protein